MKQKQLMMKEELDTFLKKNADKALRDFDAMFAENSSGENVPTHLIEVAHIDIAH